MKKITVIGSMSIDLVVSASKRPGKGETILGDDFFTTPGGKGANQAVAAARLGEKVQMVGRIGEDDFGKEIYGNLKNNHVIVDGVEPVTHVPSGTAHITLSEQDNSIIVVPSANNEVTPDFVKKHLEALTEGDIVLLQQEIPSETVEYVVEFCSENGLVSILNPAPYREINKSIIEKVDYLTPNETESDEMFKGDLDDALSAYPMKLIVTLGDKGAVYHNGKEKVQVDGFKRDVKDTTGAGDTFNGAFAVALQKEYNLEKALAFANLAASYSVTGMGAQGGMPTLEDIKGEWNV
ncbi:MULTISPECIES: ribokinase [Mammaliicoccus]|uniref:Ribokinase n=1 Tax=Mammaliicoccus fleurettii TaxID=150056 RepID=A0ABS5MMR4_9STAP|nr:MULTISPECIES: ribokinase [Mammaliicoccus]MBL0846724.1 ribokinase [Mammaliicoccus fleurettii]MBO3061865.1 ribokinase [Mammaliicoccus fleurettii]MBS3672280.1 ribokinase [Mammaliicoccus fleurettii]MBS3697186.1 ribokinase [Mammaliicoccus fleurettii]MEB6201343.1 ribokinase [Mammaliicoccus fleurettii]